MDLETHFTSVIQSTIIQKHSFTVWRNLRFRSKKTVGALRALATRRGRPRLNSELIARRTAFVHRLASDQTPRSRSTDLEQAPLDRRHCFIAQVPLT